MSIHLLSIKGVGPVAFGLDWVRVNRFDKPEARIKSDAAANKSQWVYVNKDQKHDSIFFTLLGKSESKQKPIAASTILTRLVDKPTFVAFQKIDDDVYWVIAITEGAPAYKKGNSDEWSNVDVATTKQGAQDLLGRMVLSMDSSTPIYTNDTETVALVTKEHAVFEQQIIDLIRGVKKKDAKHAYFSAYRVKNYWKYIIPIVVVVGGIGYYITTEMDSAEKARKARAEQAKQLKLRKEQLAADVEQSFNAKKNAVERTEEIYSFLDSVPKRVEGWFPKEITCDNSLCIIDFEGGKFSTWVGYERAKPQAWPAADTSGNIAAVKQQIPLESRIVEKRDIESLEKVSKVIFDLGNLSQLAKVANVSLIILPNTTPIAGTEDDKWVPRQIGLSAQGPAHLARSFIARLPKNTALESLKFSIQESATFDFNGFVYAKN
ncbi:type 4b pilus protein PilO2 [Comamonas testosteroni]|uniref:type 4b pilus protein PilO2 n=1 Tax=Comamonas testosteroni TaxID=285 RepID=UPI0005B488B7|nr:type 4b pilus protein PilO2 [Comamonas testosteroni]